MLKKILAVAAIAAVTTLGLQPSVANEKMTDAYAAPNPASYEIHDIYWDNVRLFDGSKYVEGWVKVKVAVPRIVTCENFDPTRNWENNCDAYLRFSAETFLSDRREFMWFNGSIKDATGKELTSIYTSPSQMPNQKVGEKWSESRQRFRSEKSQTLTLSFTYQTGYSASIAFQVVAISKEQAEKERLEAEAKAARDAAAKKDAESNPVRPASQPKVAQKTLSIFSGTTTQLNDQQRAQIKAAVDENPDAEKFICTGIRFESAPTSENIVVRKRAKEACEYAKQLNPNLSTWYQNKPTKARSYAGKVLLTMKAPLVASVGVTKTSWPWLNKAADVRGDGGQSPVDLDILESRLRMDTDRRMSFYVDFSSRASLSALRAAGSEVRIGFDTNQDEQEDYFVSSASFLNEGVLDGTMRRTGSMAPVANCPVAMQILENTIYTSFNADCFGDVSALNFKLQTLSAGSQTDASPDSGWYNASLKLSEVFTCSKNQKGKSFTEAGVKYFCMLQSGTVSNGKWQMVAESKVTDTNYLKMYSCASAQKGNVVTIERSTSTSKYVCGKLNNKWVYMTEAQAAAEEARAAAAAKAAAAKAAAAARAKKVASARYSTHKAYYYCGLDSSSKKIWAEVADNGRTLILNAVGKYRFTDLALQYEDYECVANYLKMPKSVQSKVGTTRALDGTLDGRWGSLTAFWNYHPDNGMNITFTLVN